MYRDQGFTEMREGWIPNSEILIMRKKYAEEENKNEG